MKPSRDLCRIREGELACSAIQILFGRLQIENGGGGGGGDDDDRVKF